MDTGLRRYDGYLLRVNGIETKHPEDSLNVVTSIHWENDRSHVRYLDLSSNSNQIPTQQARNKMKYPQHLLPRHFHKPDSRLLS